MHEQLIDRARRSAALGIKYTNALAAPAASRTRHEIVWKLLDVEKAIGASLTSAHQIMPEQSTAAIVIHHPRAAYFNAAAVRELATA